MEKLLRRPPIVAELMPKDASNPDAPEIRAGLDSLTTSQESVDALLARLRTDRVIYIPIRHHSPACALNVRKTILERRPSAVLVEGPADMTPLVKFILHPETRTPFAVYTTYADKAGRLGPLNDQDGKKREAARFAAYFPFCDYSPELAALRAGKEVGAELRFIDLTWPQHVLAERREEFDTARPRSSSLLDEAYLRRSVYLRTLASRCRCRDVNELWDQLFEITVGDMAPDDFFRRVAAYCLMARLDTPSETMQRDGTLVRERAMAIAIRDQFNRNKKKGLAGPVIVVTGGFHTAALPDLVDAKRSPEKVETLDLAADEAQTVLMRYSFDRLDALNGYASGMPAPHYYQQVWKLLGAGRADPYSQIAASVVVQIGRLSREKELPFALSTADEIAALEQANRLARLRGHPGPSREDLLDGIRSSFVKGALDVEGAVVLSIVRHVLAGTGVGNIPAGAGVPPLVEDFRRRATALGLAINDTVSKKLSLDLYRNQSHRELSRFLHSMDHLKAALGSITGGPDFVRGRGLELMQEHWQYGWSPLVESALIEASVYGSTVEEACINRLRHRIAELEDSGQSRNTTEAVRMLIRACRMGLHGSVKDVIHLIDRNVAEDPSFASLVTGLGELTMLWQSREPLEAHRLPQIPLLAQTAYRRASFLSRDLATCPDDQQDSALAAMSSLRQILAGSREDLFDPSLFLDALADLLSAQKAPATIVGGAVGVLFGEGRITEESLLTLATGYLNASTGEPASKTGFLRGLLCTCREVAWRTPELVQRIDTLLRSLDENAFVNAVPDLRMAFTYLTPRETDRVAGLVANLHGEKDLGNLIHRDVNETQFAFNVKLSHAVSQWLKDEYLGNWLAGKEGGNGKPTA
jgi:hypothetical protein